MTPLPHDASGPPELRERLSVDGASFEFGRPAAVQHGINASVGNPTLIPPRCGPGHLGSVFREYRKTTLRCGQSSLLPLMRRINRRHMAARFEPTFPIADEVSTLPDERCRRPGCLQSTSTPPTPRCASACRTDTRCFGTERVSLNEAVCYPNTRHSINYCLSKSAPTSRIPT